MKALTVFTMMLAGCCLWAQDYPRFELSAGYSYGSVDTEGYGSQRQAQGWTGSLTTNLRRFVGAELEASGRYNSLTFDFQGNSLTANNPYYTFLAGPRFAYRRGKMSPFIHSLLGVDRAPAYDNTVLDPQTGTGTTPFVTGFASATGGGVDYSIGRHLLFRSQADYFFTRHASQTSPTPNNFRVLAAIVFTFGGSETLSAHRGRSTASEAVMAHASENEPAERLRQPSRETGMASARIAQPVPPARIPAEADFVAPLAEPRSFMKAEVAAPEPAKLASKVEANLSVSQPVAVSPPPAAAKAETAFSQSVVMSSPPVAPTQQALAGTQSASSPYSVIISQPSDQLYQAASQPQESLGDVARRYRQKRQGSAANSGL